MGIFPGNRQVGMTKALLHIKRIGTSFQEERCVGAAE